ncbi:MAG: FtsX-like permease family protein [Gemmatimonadetes bacterium]|nr:FtsX-like permease family protein [Gemmatimonadota bacterium]
MVGRTLSVEDEAPGSPDVVVLSEALWAGRYARDPDVLGRVLRVGARDHTVVGVMPGEFRYPIDQDAWIALKARGTDHPLGEGPTLLVFGRLADGIDEWDADAEAELVTARLIRDHPEIYERRVGQVVPMSTLLLGEGEGLRNDPEVLLVQTLLIAMLLIVCGNVGVLVLARAATRTAEMSVRTALGASRSRIVVQIFVEALVLALVATGAGLTMGEALARWLMGLATSPAVSGIPFWMDMTLTADIVLLALGLAVGCAVVAGVIPALKATRKGVQSNLQRSATGSTMRFGWGSTSLIVSEVVLAVGFLAMGGTLVRSAFQEKDGLLGLDPARFLYAEVVQTGTPAPSQDPAASEEETQNELATLQVEILRRLGEFPDVSRAGMGRQVPGRTAPDARVLVEDEGLSQRRMRVAQVDAGFFRQLDHPILQGRNFTTADLEDGPDGHRAPVIVNTGFVEDVLQGRNPIGLRFRYAGPVAEGERPRWHEIVGVVGPLGMNVHNPLRDAGVYHPLGPGEANPMRYVIETEGDPTLLAPRFRTLVTELDPEAAVPSATSLEEMIQSESRILRWLFLGQVMLAAVAFLLSVTGLYALMSFTVSQRRREIGVRTALGARPWSIVKTIARRAAIQLALGLALGGVWAWILLREIVDDSMTIPTNVPGTIAVTLRGLRIQPVEAMGDH